MTVLRRLMGCAKTSYRLFAAACLLTCVIVAHAAASNTPWDAPAAELARRIADVLGPASVRLNLQNLSSVPNDTLPVIRRLLEEALKADGVTITNAESANLLRVTLSESAHGGLWVAEVVEGNQTRVVMVTLSAAPSSSAVAKQKVLLNVETIAKASDLPWKATGLRDLSVSPILAAAQVSDSLVVLTSTRVAVFHLSGSGSTEVAHAELGAHATSRDPGGVIIPAAEGAGFEAYAPGAACTGTPDPASTGSQPANWIVHCHSSDDPWPLVQTPSNTWTKAFYNSGRNYFTGVITPSPGVDLPAFYTAALLPARAAGPALLIGGIDGKVFLVENGQMKPVTGTRDWGSDFAVLNSTCGGGAQIIVSSSGEGTVDSLRSYELPAQEAVAVSAPLMLGGTAMGLWPAADGRSAIAVVRKALEQGHGFDYEVDRVSESCN